MKEVNLEAISEHVSTQYRDMTGIIQIDGHDNISSIYKLCDENGFNTDGKFIIGFGFGENTLTGIGERNSIDCTVLYVDKNEYGNNFEAIAETIKKNGLKLKKRYVTIPYTSLGKYIKRFDFLAMTELTSYTDRIEIEEGSI